MVRSWLLDKERDGQLVHLLFSAECFSRALGDGVAMLLLDAGLSDSAAACIAESIIAFYRAADPAELESRLDDALDEQFEASLATCLTQEEMQGIRT